MENNASECLNNESVAEPKKEIDVKSTPTTIKDKRNGKDEKSRKKDDKSIEQVLKSLIACKTSEEKLSVMCKKYVEILDENRKLHATLKQTEKKVSMIQREKEQCQSEKSKAVLTRSRLESLCRELQRQNKAVKEESLLKIREEEEKRKEVSAKFQSTLAEITALMTETNEKNIKLHDDNVEIHKKFKTVFDEMDIREQHFEGIHQLMKRELQAVEAKLIKVTLESNEEKEAFLKEKNQLLLKLTEYQTRIKELQTVEAGLRGQIAIYTDKYEEFQNALSKSNAVFGEFNKEMEKMSKKYLKETNVWKSRWEKNHAALLEMAADKQTRDNEIITLNRKCSLLQELCKAFQQERSTLLAQLKEKSVPGSNEQISEDNQKLIEGVKDITDNPLLNGSIILSNTNANIKEQTKEQKTESTCTMSASEVNVSDSTKQIEDLDLNLKLDINTSDQSIKNVNLEIVNKEDNERLMETVSKIEEKIQIIDNINKDTVQENLLNNSTEQILQVPVELDSSVATNNSTMNPEKLIEHCDINKESEDNDETTNPSTATECINQLEDCGKIEDRLQETIITETENVPKIKNHVEDPNVVIETENTHPNTAITKKHKDGRKKKNKN